MGIMRSLWLATNLAVGLATAQSLPSCAQSCVGTTRTKCESTDFLCACTDARYIPKLSKCIDNFCENADKEQAYLYLTQLCASVGVTLEKGHEQIERIEVRLAVPRARLEGRQSFDDVSFTEIFGPSITDRIPLSTTGSPASSSATSTSVSGGDGDDISGGGGGGGSSRKKSGFSAGAKVGVGVAIPLVLGLLAGIVLLIKRSKQKKIPQHVPDSGAGVGTQGGQPGQGPQGQPQMAQAHPPMATGPAELSQSAMYAGHEMETKSGNTTEMPASPVPGYIKPEFQGQQTPPPVYAQPQAQPYPQSQSPPIPQSYGPQSPPIPAAYAPVQQQHQQHQQWTPPPHGQQVPQQQQWSSPPPQQGQWVFVPSPSAEQPGQGQPYYPPQQQQYTQASPPPQELPERK